MYQDTYDNLKLYFPYIAEDAASIKETSIPGELLIETDTGDIVLYDNMDKTIRYLPKDSSVMSEDECRREFGIRMRRMMIRKNISQAELAERTGISAPILSGYMNCRHNPSFYNACKIARALGCSIDDLRYI